MTQKDKSLAILTQRMKQKNPAVVNETYEYFASTFSSPPRMSHEGMRVAIDMLAQRSPEIKFDTNVNISAAVTRLPPCNGFICVHSLAS